MAPVLVLLLGALLETGSFILLQTQLQYATANAARQIRILNVGPTTTATGAINQKTLAQFKDEVCHSFDIPNCRSRIRIDVRSELTFGDLKTSMPNPLVGVGPTRPGNSYNEIYTPGPPGVVGALIVTYDWEFVFPPVGLIFGNVATYPGIRRLTGLSVYRNETR